jgi:hypothetical protein
MRPGADRASHPPPHQGAPSASPPGWRGVGSERWGECSTRVEKASPARTVQSGQGPGRVRHPRSNRATAPDLDPQTHPGRPRTRRPRTRRPPTHPAEPADRAVPAPVELVRGPPTTRPSGRALPVGWTRSSRPSGLGRGGRGGSLQDRGGSGARSLRSAALTHPTLAPASRSIHPIGLEEGALPGGHARQDQDLAGSHNSFAQLG